jgi:hypothetical protein
MIAMRDHRPPVSPGRLAEVQAKLAELGHPIPPSYREFLSDHDGGDPVRDHFTFRQGDRDEHDVVQWFYGIEPSPEGDLVEIVELIPGRFLAGTLPIVADASGNYLLLDRRDGRDGPVWFWDHDLQVDPPDQSNLFWVATDLHSFLDRLVEVPDPAPPVAPGR